MLKITLLGSLASLSQVLLKWRMSSVCVLCCRMCWVRMFSQSVISGCFIYSSVHQFQSSNLSLPPYLLILNSYLYETENSDLANWITGKWYNAWLSFLKQKTQNQSRLCLHPSQCADLCPLSSSCSPSIPVSCGILPTPL